MNNDSLRLIQTQRQQQTLAPMQLQFVKMLEMTGPEAEEEVRRALDDNPALERVDDDGDMSTSHDEDFNESAEQMQLADYRSDDIPSYRLEASNRSVNDPYYEPIVAERGRSLMDWLMSQLSERPDVDPRTLSIARFVVGNIDNNGYLTRDVAAIADDLAIQEGTEVDIDEVRRAWQVVRDLDPAGVGATDLRDSLLLQLARMTPSPVVTHATEIIRDYFDLFSLMHFDRIASLSGMSRPEMQQAIDLIKTLNPKPGSIADMGYDDAARPIIPDFSVEADGDRLTLTLLNRLPRLTIEQSFAPDSEVARKTASSRHEAANAFLRQKREEAATFIKVVEMRQQTLFTVMSAIMQWQRQFFLTGDSSLLRPMILKDISAITGYDASVISRATAGKYVATRFGVFPLKYFFSEKRNPDDEVSSRAVLDKISHIIETENKRSPLSDAAITDMLRTEGLDIARRTVAKYRERLGLPVARLRRQFIS